MQLGTVQSGLLKTSSPARRFKMNSETNKSKNVMYV